MRLSKNTRLAGVIVAAGLLLSFAGAYAVKRNIDRDEEKRLDIASTRIVYELKEKLGSNAFMLLGSRAIIARNAVIDHREWSEYIALFEGENAMSGVRGAGFIALLRPDQLAAHTSRIRAGGSPGYRVWPAGARDVYSSIVYIEPPDESNRKFLGYDMLSEPVRHAAMATARDTGRAALSGRVTLIQDGGKGNEPGMLMYVPVYRTGVKSDTLQARRAALTGWVYSAYHVKDLLKTVLVQSDLDEAGAVHVCIRDVTASSASSILLDNGNVCGAAQSPWTRTEVMNFDGRRWELTFRFPEAGGIMHYAWVLAAFALGWLLTGLLAALFLSMVKRHQLANAMVAKLSADIREQEVTLSENEARWRAALEGSGLGVWDWDVVGNKAYLSPVYKTMLGYEDGDITNAYQSWVDLIHPDDVDQVMDYVDEYLLGGNETYEVYHRLRCKSGAYKWILSRGVIQKRLPSGPPMRIVGTHTDIDMERDATIRAIRRSVLYAALAQCNAALAQCSSKQEIAASICEILVRELGLNLAWIGFTDDETGMVEPAYSCGPAAGYLEDIEISINADDPRGRGPTGEAFRSGAPVWCNDFSADPSTRPWQERAASFGLRGSAAMAIHLKGSPVAVLSIYAGEAGYFDEEARPILSDMAAQCGLAMEMIEAKIEARSLQENLALSEMRYRTLFESSVDGIIVANTGGMAISANPAACAMLGRSEEEIIRIGRVGILDDVNQRYVNSNAAELGSGSHTGEAVFIRGDGSRIVVEISAWSYQASSGEKLVSFIFRDITSRKGDRVKLEAQIEELRRWYNAMLGRENRILELKREVNDALRQAGVSPRYETVAGSSGEGSFNG